MKRTANDPSPLRQGNRRVFLAAALSGAALLPGRGLAAVPLRFGTTPVFLNEQIGLLDRWQRLLEARLDRPVRFVQRGSYREIVDLLLGDGVEAAWLCGHPLVLHESRLSVVAVPRYQGAPLYRSHLIVPAADASTRQVSDLRGRVFAYSDPLSNSGFLVPRAEIAGIGANPASFFRRSFFTFSHRKVVDAVRAGLADGGAVDGYVWDTIAAQQPASVAGLRVAWRSAPHGFPPVVSRLNWAAAEARQLGDALRGMSAEAEGRAILERLNIDGFEEPRAGQFDSIRALLRVSERSGP
ncbi:MAG: PhnD/SsuA/transferrin family substrate-binding protein [Rubrivivax sp.]|nr:PhnD/SsuA/transferrin family substrate-binding protein [Rubrivivax sp.]